MRTTLEDLPIRNYSPSKVRACILSVADFAEHFNKSPDKRGPGGDPILCPARGNIRSEAHSPHFRKRITALFIGNCRIFIPHSSHSREHPCSIVAYATMPQPQQTEYAPLATETDGLARKCATNPPNLNKTRHRRQETNPLFS